MSKLNQVFSYGVVKVTLQVAENYYDGVEYIDKVIIELNDDNKIIQSVGSDYLLSKHPLATRITNAMTLYLDRISETMNDYGFNLTVYQFNKIFNDDIIDVNLVVVNSDIQGMLREYHGVTNTDELIELMKREQNKGEYVSEAEDVLQSIINEIEGLPSDEFTDSVERQLLTLHQTLKDLRSNL